MAVNHTVKYCALCQARTQHLYPAASNGFHLLLTFMTLGLWIAVWILIALIHYSEATCLACSTRPHIVQQVNVMTAPSVVSAAALPRPAAAPPPLPLPAPAAPIAPPQSPRARFLSRAREAGGLFIGGEVYDALGDRSDAAEATLKEMVKCGEVSMDLGSNGEIHYTVPSILASRDSIFSRVLPVAAESGGRLTATKAAIALGVPIPRAEVILRLMVDDQHVRVETQPSGKAVFEFVDLVEG